MHMQEFFLYMNQFLKGNKKIYRVADRWNLPRMVNKLMRPYGRSMSTDHPVFPEYEASEFPRRLGSPTASALHCLFPDDHVPLSVQYR